MRRQQHGFSFRRAKVSSNPDPTGLGSRSVAADRGHWVVRRISVMSLSPAVRTLCENSNDVFLDVSMLLLTYADNIIRSVQFTI